MPEGLALTRLLNHLFGPLVAAVLQTVGVHPAHPAAPINDTFTLELLVACGLIAFFLFVRLTLSVENPGPAQHIAEMIHEFASDQSEQIIGHGYERFQSFLVCVGLFILLNNLIGLLAGFPNISTPTGSPVVPLGVAVLTFLYYNFHALRKQGLIGYAKHLAGPLWWLTPLLFPIEITSHLARMLSLTVRLYANMLASDMITLVAFSMLPLLVPALGLGLHFAVSLIQAYVFMLLATIYLAEAVAQEH
jgi:F-type H+-transporting ATPase subunit a